MFLTVQTIWINLMVFQLLKKTCFSKVLCIWALRDAKLNFFPMHNIYQYPAKGTTWSFQKENFIRNVPIKCTLFDVYTCQKCRYYTPKRYLPPIFYIIHHDLYLYHDYTLACLSTLISTIKELPRGLQS